MLSGPRRSSLFDQASGEFNLLFGLSHNFVPGGYGAASANAGPVSWTGIFYRGRMGLSYGPISVERARPPRAAGGIDSTTVDSTLWGSEASTPRDLASLPENHSASSSVPDLLRPTPSVSGSDGSPVDGWLREQGLEALSGESLSEGAKERGRRRLFGDHPPLRRHRMVSHPTSGAEYRGPTRPVEERTYGERGGPSTWEG